MKVAVLDDYQNLALQLADWSGVRRHAVPRDNQGERARQSG